MPRADRLLDRVVRSVWQEIAEPRRLVLRLECGHDHWLLDLETAAQTARRVVTGLNWGEAAKQYVINCGHCAAIPHPRTNPDAMRAIAEARRDRAAGRLRARRQAERDEGYGYED